MIGRLEAALSSLLLHQDLMVVVTQELKVVLRLDRLEHVQVLIHDHENLISVRRCGIEMIYSAPYMRIDALTGMVKNLWTSFINYARHS